MMKNWVVALEHSIKHSLFNCQMCGQCILTYTSMRCPMNCPKGLRNGPCGGTLDGHCEVYPDRNCVWMEIRGREARGANRQFPVPPVHAPVHRDLFGSSSYLNLLSGRDQDTRPPMAYLELVPAPERREPVGTGRLEAALRRGEFVVTTECHSPRTEDGLKRVHRFGRTVRGHVHAVNTTSNVGGRPTLPSRRTGAILQNDYGLEAIIQCCGRDVGPAEFLSEVSATQEAGFKNLFCMTGDWNRVTPSADGGETPAEPPPSYDRYFPMDAVQMLYEARHLRETGVSAYLPGRAQVHTLFLGGALNPASTPREFVLARLEQKLAAGLDFVETQIITDSLSMGRFMEMLRQAHLLGRFYLIASVPVVTNLKMLDLMGTLAGVHVDSEFDRRLRTAPDMAREGVRAASDLAEELRRLGVHGVHLMPFGATGDDIVEIASGLRATGTAESTAARNAHVGLIQSLTTVQGLV
ncbi:MAG TPA: methylenetetrahydrofolate reductase C-terminal domain-containing protein [Planctomycetota bacterium]|nr:methylenetetrahydrofolate reductase C-terminal domain-containing protein [Planctomycetota bacterium]